MNILFAKIPEMYGLLHMTALVLIMVTALLVYRYSASLSKKTLCRIIGILGLVMCTAEIWKQYFCMVYVNAGAYSFWFFPFQLCSIAMYLAVLFPFVSEKTRRTFASFQSSYTLIAAICALAYPQDMLRIQVLLTLHGFLYHGLMIILTVLSLRYMILSGCHIRSSVYLFILCACIAEAINFLGHKYIHDPSGWPNMFYITPYIHTTQPVFSLLSVRIGIIPTVLVYLSCISICARLLLVFYCRKYSLHRYN